MLVSKLIVLLFNLNIIDFVYKKVIFIVLSVNSKSMMNWILNSLGKDIYAAILLDFSLSFVNMLQIGNSHATPFWSKIFEVTDGQKLFGQSLRKPYKCATCWGKILSCMD